MSDTSTADEGIDIRKRLEQLPISTWHIPVFVICAFTLLCDSADQFIIISIAPLLIREWSISGGAIGLIIAATGVGGIIGAPLFGFLADRIGRRRCMVLSIAIYSVLTGLAALADNVGQLIVIRALAGVGLGGLVPVALAYVGEFSPPKWRGRIVAWWNSMFAFGISLAGAVGLYVIVPYGWRWGFLAGAAPIVLLPFILWLPESIRYLVSSGKYQEAEKTIARVERRITGQEKAARSNPVRPSGNQPDSAPSGRLRPWRTFMLMRAHGMGPTMIASAVLWFLPSAILLSQFFGVFLTQSLGLDLKAAVALVTATSVFGPIGQFTAGFLSDWVGRKMTLTVALLLLGTMPIGAFIISPSQSMTFACLALTWIGTSAIYGTAFGYTAEQLPTELRAGGLGIFEGLRRTGGAVGPAAIGVFYAAFGLSPVLWVALAGCVATIIVLLILGRETRGRQMTELAKTAP
jgi:MFS transporter, putative metabolite:H+ symporter